MGDWGGQVEIGWLAGRYRQQAGSYSWIGGSQVGIGWLAGRHRQQAGSHKGLRWSGRDWSAGRPPSLASQLPQGLRWSGRDWSAGRPPSLASQLPQGLRWSGRDCSAGRPPSLASRVVAPQLPQGIVSGSQKQVGCQAAVACFSKGRVSARLAFDLDLPAPSEG